MASGPLREIIVTAAHGGVSPGQVPVGGGAAVVHQLLREWGTRPPCRLTLLGLGERCELPGVEYHAVPVSWPPGRGPDDLVHLGELAYARLCRAFERQVTEFCLARRGPGLVVVANDLSEGPDFARLAAAGVPVVTLWHVDVVAYFCRFYLAGLSPRLAVAAHRRLGPLRRLQPDVLRLVFEKQAAAVAGSRRQVVPSAPMRELIEACYPGAGARVEVVPWGAWPRVEDPAAVARERAALCREAGLTGRETVLVTLSRLSPEKGLERVLEALLLGHRRGELPPELRLLIAGEAAFMRGERYRLRLAALAARLPAGRVTFVGYAAGPRKAALWELADVYVFPSRHESYGLTLVEALAAGLPVVTCGHQSAADLVDEETGLIVPNEPARLVPERLWTALRTMANNPERRSAMAAAAQRRGAERNFSAAAARVLEICREVAGAG